ncbi:MAG: hypothetical protein ABIG64_02490 [Candidatus Omnitrophota bacterium]
MNEIKSNNLFIQRRFQVQKEIGSKNFNLIGSLYIAYYFYVKEELYVSKYAICVKIIKTEAQIKELLMKQ